MSKGSNRRPAAVPSSVVDERWARTFGSAVFWEANRLARAVIEGFAPDALHAQEDEMRRNGYIPVHSGTLTEITEA